MSHHKLTANQEQELHDAFNLFDRDRSGTISAKELKALCKELGIKVNDREVHAILKQMDVDGDGEISFKEFSR